MYTLLDTLERIEQKLDMRELTTYRGPPKPPDKLSDDELPTYRGGDSPADLPTVLAGFEFVTDDICDDDFFLLELPDLGGHAVELHLLSNFWSIQHGIMDKEGGGERYLTLKAPANLGTEFEEKYPTLHAPASLLPYPLHVFVIRKNTKISAGAKRVHGVDADKAAVLDWIAKQAEESAPGKFQLVKLNKQTADVVEDDDYFFNPYDQTVYSLAYGTPYLNNRPESIMSQDFHAQRGGPGGHEVKTPSDLQWTWNLDMLRTTENYAYLRLTYDNFSKIPKERGIVNCMILRRTPSQDSA